MTGVSSVTHSLLTEIFPRENYKKAGSKMAIHFLVALGEPNDTIIKWIDAHPDYLNHRDQKYLNLSPLAVCVLKGNKVVAQVLLKKGANPTLGDHKSWTPLHHAVVSGNEDMLEILKENGKGAAETLRNSMGGTYLDLKKLFSVEVANDNDEVCYLREAGKVEKCTAKEFREKTQASYCRSVIVTPSQLIMSWKKPEPKMGRSPIFKAFIEQEYARCINRPAKLSIGKSDLSDLQGYDVFVEESIPAFQGITIYGGALENDTTNTDYLLDGIDGQKVRNLGPMINDGFPNCMCHLVMIGGFRYYVIFSIREIKSGEKLYWNYGISHSIKLAYPHLELNSRELVHMAESVFQIVDLLLNSTSEPSQLKEIQNYLGHKQRLTYLLETPSALLYLLSQNCFPIQGLILIDENFELIAKKLELPSDKIGMLSRFLKMCCSIEVVLKHKLKADALITVVKEIREVLFLWSTTLPMSLVINCSAFFVSTLVEEIKSTEDWKEFKEDLQDYVAFMEALHYFCSQVPSINYLDFLPKIKMNYAKLSLKKKEECLLSLTHHLNGLQDDRKKLLTTLKNELIEE